MANHVLLNNNTHKNLKVNTAFSAKTGDNISHTLTFPTEFVEIQREYPIIFSKHPDTGAFQSVVMFGLKKDENLFIKRGKWQANYIPAVIQKGPFIIGFEEQETNGEIHKNPVICVDMDNPKVNHKDGDAIFDHTGNATPLLENINHCLMKIKEGIELSKQMFAAFIEHDLLEPVGINIELNNQEKITIEGNYTINQEKLSQLNGESLEQLNKQGFLQMAYLAVASLSNIQKLVDMQNTRI